MRQSSLRKEATHLHENKIKRVESAFVNTDLNDKCIKANDCILIKVEKAFQMVIINHGLNLHGDVLQYEERRGLLRIDYRR